jgi:hypothetical protein
MTTGKSTAVLLCNLGTPDAPTAAALRRYLGQFLSDPRVVEIPRVLWLPQLHGVILRVRQRRSAAKYESVWTEAGSPLAVWTQRQVAVGVPVDRHGIGAEQPFGDFAQGRTRQGRVERLQGVQFQQCSQGWPGAGDGKG